MWGLCADVRLPLAEDMTPARPAGGLSVGNGERNNLGGSLGYPALATRSGQAVDLHAPPLLDIDRAAIVWAIANYKPIEGRKYVSVRWCEIVFGAA